MKGLVCVATDSDDTLSNDGGGLPTIYVHANLRDKKQT